MYDVEDVLFIEENLHWQQARKRKALWSLHLPIFRTHKVAHINPRDSDNVASVLSRFDEIGRLILRESFARNFSAKSDSISTQATDLSCTFWFMTHKSHIKRDLHKGHKLESFRLILFFLFFLFFGLRNKIPQNANRLDAIPPQIAQICMQFLLNHSRSRLTSRYTHVHTT